MTGRLKGRTVLVTGAGRNLGLTIATQLADEGAHVVTHARDREEAQDSASQVAAATGGAATPLAFDLADPTATADGFATLDRAGVVVDALVCSAAHLGLHDAQTLGQPPEFLDEVLAVNVGGVYRCVLHMARRLVARGQPGSVVVISSLAGERAIHDRLAYNTSKAAVDGMVRSFALDLARHSIRVNGIAPGYVWSRRWEQLSGEEARARRALIPIGIETAQSEIARLTAFLISDDAPTLTGERIVIDGGLSAQQSPPPYRGGG